MINSLRNIFAEISENGEEQITTLLENRALKIERIVSHSHSSPEGFWYDQSRDEWVIVLRGSALLEFTGGELIEMKEGDYLMIPRRTRHRVNGTSHETIWLAVHLKEGNRQ